MNIHKWLLILPLVVISCTSQATIFDFDGDDKADFAVWRASNQTFYIKNSSGNSFDSDRSDGIQRHSVTALASDIAISGDFDGDGIQDVGIRRPQSYQWIIRYSSSGEINTQIFGRNESDIPVPADYDGDGITDIAVRRSSNFTWYILNSSGVDNRSNHSDGISRIVFGRQVNDIPVPADYDGDGRTDIAVRRSNNFTWYIQNSSLSNFNSERMDGIQRIVFGRDSSDIPVPADYTGDGFADIAVRRPSNATWYIKNSNGSNENSERGDGIQRIVFGMQQDDIPIPADYDGDGKADIAIRRPASFEFIYRSSDSEQIISQTFARNQSDIPLAANVTAKQLVPGEENIVEEPPADARGYFEENVSQQIIQSVCINCHTESGVAAGTDLILVPDSDPEHTATNYRLLSDFLALDNVTVDYILANASGMGHGGGVQLPIGSDRYLTLQTWLHLLDSEVNGN